MVRLYYTDNNAMEDQRLPRFSFPPKQVPLNRLLKKTGVYYCKVDIVDQNQYRKRIDMIRAERKYTYVDDCMYQAGVTQDYEEKLPMWFEAHMHEEDEARLLTDGSAYYDVQEPKTEKWIRIHMEPGDMLIIPPGCIHRFTPDMKNYSKFRRFFSKQQPSPPKFSIKEAKVQPARLSYLKRFTSESGSNTSEETQLNENKVKVEA